MALCEETILSWDEFRGRAALRINVRYIAYSRAHRITLHHQRIERFQQLRHGSHISEARIKPEIVGVGIEYHRHAIVHDRRDSVRRRGQDRARLDGFALRVLPSLPKASECEEFASVDLEAVRLLGLAPSLSLVEALNWNNAAAVFQKRVSRPMPNLRFSPRSTLRTEHWGGPNNHLILTANSPLTVRLAAPVSE